MDHLPAPSFDPALLDMENMTADKWSALIYNKIVQQEDIFVGDIKKKVIEIINMCMNKPNSTLESVRQDITSTIADSQFKFEHQHFIEGIVGGTYEYLCQFIIKNSMENIKRTQSALNCFSLSNNLNYGATKSCCNDNILLQGSSKLTQIQCSLESNTTDSDKAIQSYILSNNSENDSDPILMVERENIKNTTVNKMETTSLLNYRSTLQINNLSVKPANDIPLFSNMHNNDNVDSAHSSTMIDDDEKTTEAILSIASKIEQSNFNFVDDFEADDINTSNVCTTDEIQTTKCLIEQNGDQHTDTSKLEEEYKMNNSLKLLETLVNIEHDKLEVQKSITVNEIQPNIETNEKMRFKSSKKTNIREKKSRKLQENIHKVEEEEEEEWLPNFNKLNCCSKTRTKIIKSKSHIDKAYKKNRKSEVQNTMNPESTNNTIHSIEIENAENISLALIGTLISTYKKRSDTSDPTKPIELYGGDEKIEKLPQVIENFVEEGTKKILTNGGNKSNTLYVKTSHLTDASNFTDKNGTSETAEIFTSVMKALDYKKQYEKDRKRLFIPDAFITRNVSSKPSKDTTNELHLKKEYLDKKAKSKEQKVETNNKISDRKRKLSKPTVKDSLPKTAQDSKSKPNSKQKSSYVKRSRKRYKKLRVISSDDESESNASNPNYESNSILENKVSDNIGTLELQKLYKPNILENNEFGEGTSRQFDEVNIFENKMSNRDTLEEEAMPEWLRKKCKLYDIKPLYVVINPFMRY